MIPGGRLEEEPEVLIVGELSVFQWETGNVFGKNVFYRAEDTQHPFLLKS